MSANVTSNASASQRQLSKRLRRPSGESHQTGSQQTVLMQSTQSARSTQSVVKQKPVLSAQYSHRVMINFQMSSRVLTPQLPAGLELQPFRAAYYVTFMIGHMKGVKLFGLPGFPGFNTISLRTYVRSIARPELAGTLTLRRYVSSSAGAWLLRKYLSLPAQVIPIKRKVETAQGALLPSVGYLWKTGDAESILRVKARSQIFTTSENSKHGWMLDHLNEFSVPKKKVILHRTAKPDCKTFDVAKATFKCNAKKMFGPSFVKPLTGRPASVYLFHGGKTQFLASEKL